MAASRYSIRKNVFVLVFGCFSNFVGMGTSSPTTLSCYDCRTITISNIIRKHLRHHLLISVFQVRNSILGFLFFCFFIQKLCYGADAAAAKRTTVTVRLYLSFFIIIINSDRNILNLLFWISLFFFSNN